MKAAAAGIPGAGSPVVEFSNDGSKHTEGPAGRHYEQEHARRISPVLQRVLAGVEFCLFQMYMRDS